MSLSVMANPRKQSKSVRASILVLHQYNFKQILFTGGQVVCFSRSHSQVDFIVFIDWTHADGPLDWEKGFHRDKAPCLSISNDI